MHFISGSMPCSSWDPFASLKLFHAKDIITTFSGFTFQRNLSLSLSLFICKFLRGLRQFQVCFWLPVLPWKCTCFIQESKVHFQVRSPKVHVSNFTSIFFLLFLFYGSYIVFGIYRYIFFGRSTISVCGEQRTRNG